MSFVYRGVRIFINPLACRSSKLSKATNTEGTMTAKLAFRLIVLGMAFFFPKAKIPFGYVLIGFAHLILAFCLFAAWADYGTQPNSVVRFEIIMGFIFMAAGWLIGITLIKQGRKTRETEQYQDLSDM
jgi:hypothetical protein